MKKSLIDYIALILLIIGGISWGLTVFGFNLVESITFFGWLAKTVYVLVGLAGVYSIYLLFK